MTRILKTQSQFKWVASVLRNCSSYVVHTGPLLLRLLIGPKENSFVTMTTIKGCVQLYSYGMMNLRISHMMWLFTAKSAWDNKLFRTAFMQDAKCRSVMCDSHHGLLFFNAETGYCRQYKKNSWVGDTAANALKTRQMNLLSRDTKGIWTD